MNQCPSCRREFKDDVRFCPFDGQDLSGKSRSQPARADSLTGTTLNRRYRLEAKLSSHGPIVAYGGTDLQTRQPVLVKVLDTSQNLGPNAERFFLEKARRLSEMRQAAILTVKNFAGPQAAGLPLAVLAFPAGITLRRRIDRDGALDDAHAAVVLRQVSWAVEALHGRNLFTRGWEPDNIWLDTSTEGNDVVEIDCLWLSQPIDPTQPSSRVAYLSPEECKGEQGDARSDVYRLGLLAYEMITGSLPFQSDSASDLIGLHLEEAPRPMDLVAGRPIQINVERAIMRALAKFPKYRQPSALEFARDLEAVELPSRPTTALPNIPFEATTGGVNLSGSRSTSLLQEGEFGSGGPVEPAIGSMPAASGQPEVPLVDDSAPTLEWKRPLIGEPRPADEPGESSSAQPAENSPASGSGDGGAAESEASPVAMPEPQAPSPHSEALNAALEDQVDHDAVTQPVGGDQPPRVHEPRADAEEEQTARFQGAAAESTQNAQHSAPVQEDAQQTESAVSVAAELETGASHPPEQPGAAAELPVEAKIETGDIHPPEQPGAVAEAPVEAQIETGAIDSPEQPGAAAEVPAEAQPVADAGAAQSTTVADNAAPPLEADSKGDYPKPEVPDSESPAEQAAQSEAASPEPPAETISTQEVPAAVTAPVGSQATMLLSSEPPPAAGAAQHSEPPRKQEAASEKPIYLEENVQFTVYRPKVLQPLVWSSMIAFAHLSNRQPDDPAAMADPLQEVKRQAEQILGKEIDQYKTVGADALQAFPREGDISFVPLVPGIEFNPPRATFKWEHGVHREEFRLRAATTLNGHIARGRLSVFLGAVLIGEVPLTMSVDDRYAAHPTPGGNSESTSASCYRKIFASYSHRDSLIVQQFERFAEANGDQYLRDVRELRSGELWGTRLEKAILEADVFQLFWSSNSMTSDFVRKEWEYALSLRRPNFVRPTYWEDRIASSDQHNLPPEELTRLHFQRIGYVLTTPSRVDSAESRTPTGPLASGRLSAMPTPVLPPVEPDPSKKAESPAGGSDSYDSREAGEFEFNWTPPRDHSEPAQANRPSSDATAAWPPAQQESTLHLPPPQSAQAPPPTWQAVAPPPVARPIPATAERPAIAANPQAQPAQRGPEWPPLPAYHSQPPQQSKPTAPNLAVRIIVFLVVGALFMLGFVFLLNRFWR